MTPTIELSPVILCGGSGTRLWPLSRAGFPKQFLVLSGNTSLFQQAVERVNAIAAMDMVLKKTLVVTNEEHRFLASDQLREIPHIDAEFLLEPSGKNTAPALTLAALRATEGGADPILVVTPADQTVQNLQAFTGAIQDGVRRAAAGGIVILGIKPTSAETGYGYIKHASKPGEQGQFLVEQFTEKPNAKTAQDYLDSGRYAWNSGMFILRASTWLKALEKFRPEIAQATKKAWQNKKQDGLSGTVFIRPDAHAFEQIPADSIDYAVIEKCPDSSIQIEMVALDAGWSDLGAWDAVWQVGKPDAQGNVNSGDVLHAGSKNNLVHASSRLVSTVGIENLVVIETADAVLVAKRDQSQDVKHIVNQLEKAGREEKNLHRKVARPWGWYDSVDEGERFKVKRIQVKPGASLSLQMHHHRAEHWIVVKGIAEVTNGEQVIRLTENQSTYIPQGQKHRLANPGTEPLEIIEVQSGSYLGEDDIVRFEDVYKRT